MLELELDQPLQYLRWFTNEERIRKKVPRLVSYHAGPHLLGMSQAGDWAIGMLVAKVVRIVRLLRN